jgi:hypothetical protein
MTAALVVERERIVRPREQLIASRLRRFAWRHREAVTALTRRHPRLADLALSFPALLFALAVPRRRFDPEPAIERVIAGAPLSELAKDAAVPMWTRKLMPEAFLGPLPTLPDGDIFRRQIANHLPRRPRDAFPWLEAVSRAFVWGDDLIAIWVARHFSSADQQYALRHWRLLCLWAWHASHPEAPVSRYIPTPWSLEMLPKNALLWALDWTDSAEALADMGGDQIADAWGERASVDGFAFDPVRNADDLIRQARTFKNCVRTYAYDLAHDRGRLWVISKDGKPVGMFHLSAYADDPYPKLGEISGVSDGSVGADAIRAAHLWFRNHVPMRAVTRRSPQAEHMKSWRSVWRHYWLDKCCIPDWLPLRYSRRAWVLLKNPAWRPRPRR